MAEEPKTFSQTRARLEEIVAQVRKKDTSLEKSLDLLEEGVRLANQCTELIDHADWEEASFGPAASGGGAQDVSPDDGDGSAEGGDGPTDDVDDPTDGGTGTADVSDDTDAGAGEEHGSADEPETD